MHRGVQLTTNHEPPTTCGQRDMRHGVVLVYLPQDPESQREHDTASHTGIACKLAALKNYEFGGMYEATRSYDGARYFVPSQTLIGVDAARALGIESEKDLFGGVVPYPFVATKAITHSLVDPAARAPQGWSAGFGHAVHDAVLAGYTAFTKDDARRAGAELLKQGQARLKKSHGIGGRGQIVVRDAAELEAALGRMQSAELAADGLVIEENLHDVTTYSVGHVCVDDMLATYYGTQCLTTDTRGETAYGGSELTIVKGGFDALLELELTSDARLAIAQARIYDAAAIEHFPGFFASRRNYDVALGLDAKGCRRSGVLEQSWRIGGASGAEIAALEVFRAGQAPRAVRASCVERYGECETPPPDATVYFRGVDARVGALTKYTIVEPYVDAR